MSAAHTPGPWTPMFVATACEGVDVAWEVSAEEHCGLAFGQSQEHLGGAGIEKSECIANARLIAAAPDLLDALQMAKHIVANEGTDAQLKQVCDAIEKATGAEA